MSTVGIICEYNPIHNGHARQIATARERGADRIVCVMSGNAVQRGELAVADKYTRAEAAIYAGADLVVELPFPYCAAGAGHFAAAGICILDALGVDEINFGSECADAKLLEKCAVMTSGEDFDTYLRERLGDCGASGTSAIYAEAFEKFTGEKLPSGSNDLLALAYFRAAHRAGITIPLTIIKREGSDYRDEAVTGAYPSATALRNMIYSGNVGDIAEYMPKGAYEAFSRAMEEKIFPVDMNRISTAVIAYLRNIEISDGANGIAGLIANTSRSVASIGELVEKIATKRYPASKLRREVLFMLTGVSKKDLDATPAYTTLLAANEKGRAIVSKKTVKGVEIVTKPADAPHCRQRELSEKLDAWFTLALPEPSDAGTFLRRSPKIV